MTKSKLSPKAEALMEKLASTYHSHQTPALIAHTIIEELGITEEVVNELKHAAADSAARSQYETAGLTIHIIHALTTLLELAEDST